MMFEDLSKLPLPSHENQLIILAKSKQHHYGYLIDALRDLWGQRILSEYVHLVSGDHYRIISIDRDNLTATEVKA